MRVRIPNPSLVVLCGPAGSGKTTFATRHFPPTAVVSSDRCRAMIADDERNIAVSREAFELFHLIIDRRVRFGRLTVADSTALRREARRALLQIGRRHGVPVILIVFDVSLERCFYHDTLRHRRVGRAVIERHIRLLQDTLRTVADEGFDQVVILDEVLARQASVDLGGSPPQRPGNQGAPAP
ncbi:MAG: AAA family ATPase [Armatimonadota bacterium]|nr:AAA family ATPase [Armatimonadota bacterium]MDR7551089.1 AAA family ATPase [Armatimonadota bacterium]